MDKTFIRIKLRREPTSGNSDLYEFKMDFFDDGDTGDFLRFVCNFNMNLEALGTLKDGAKIQHLCTLVHG